MRTDAGTVSMVNHAAVRRHARGSLRAVKVQIAIALGLGLVFANGPLDAQQAPAPPPPASQSATDDMQRDSAPASAPARDGKSGLVGVIQRWFEDTASAPRDPLKDAKQAIDDLGEKARKAGDNAIRATQESAEKLSALPGAGTVTGREKCAVAPNGAPDCNAAAARLCQAKGFSTGSSADFVASENCPAQVWLSGGRDKSSCATETHVTRAICQ